MATSNLISKSLGNIQLQSGIGAPDHDGSVGNLYLDISGGNVNSLSNFYSPTGVTSSWSKIIKNNSVSITSSATTATTTTISTAQWLSLTSSTFGWVTVSSNGFSVQNGLVTCTGLTGTYFLNSSTTLRSVSIASRDNRYRIGISKNGATPVAGLFSSNSFSSTGGAATSLLTINVFGFINLTSGDTISLSINTPLSISEVSFSGISVTAEYIE